MFFVEYRYIPKVALYGHTMSASEQRAANCSKHALGTSEKSSWGQHGSHLGPVGPGWVPCWSNEPCYHGGLSPKKCKHITDSYYQKHLQKHNMKVIDQSHRYGRHQAACREPAGSYDKTIRTAICCEHKTQYHLIRTPYTRIIVFWHISNIPPMISHSQISCNTPMLYIAEIFVRYYYTTACWLL